MEGLLIYEDTAKIIATLYVEQEQSLNQMFYFKAKFSSVLFWLIHLEATGVGLSGPEKGLYDLGVYFGNLLQQSISILLLIYLFFDWSSVDSVAPFKLIKKNRRL